MNIEDNYSENCVPGDQILRIKMAIIQDIFYAGSRWRMGVLAKEKSGDSDPNIEHARAEGIIEAYLSIVDIVWNETYSFDDSGCEDCENGDNTDLVDQIDKELKNNSKEK